MKTKLVVGLGNPGKEYEHTRHNAGFEVIDLILKELNLKLDEHKFNADYTIYRHNGDKVIFMKPLTYMNLSGTAVQELVNFYNIDLQDIIVVHDDLDLPVGKLRIRKTGSSGGQKGMGNIIDNLGSKDIKRIRVGIGDDRRIDAKDYVLSKISDPLYAEVQVKAKDAIIFSLDNEFDLVMNRFN